MSKLSSRKLSLLLTFLLLFNLLAISGPVVGEEKTADDSQVSTLDNVGERVYEEKPCFHLLSEETIHIPDENLEEAIREALDKPEGDITKEDFDHWTFLDARDRNIKNLSGLEYAVNLRSLDLRDNAIEDISVLVGLVELSYLRLDNNQITDITPLTQLTALRSLYLDHNQISDISLLKDMTQLERLYLRNTGISDILELSGMTGMKMLDLAENTVADVTPLKNMTSMEYLELSQNQISDITPLKDMSVLRILKLNQNEIDIIEPLSNLTDLIQLELNRNQISDISPLKNLQKLELWLWLDNNQIEDISALAELHKLQNLRIKWNNRLTDIAVLENMTSLTELELSGNLISDIEALSNLNNLTKLLLNDNQLTNVSPLKTNSQNGGLRQDAYIDLRYNYLDISEISPILADIQVLTSNGAEVDYQPQRDVEEKLYYQSVTVTALNTVKLNFSKDIFNALDDLGDLKNAIEFAPDGESFRPLKEDESVEISGNRLIITFAEELSGDKNKIRLAANSLEDEDGNILEEEVVTAEFEATVVEDCFIATAAYGSRMDPAVTLLKQFRDTKLLTNMPGQAFVSFYYSVSPGMAEQIAGNALLKTVTQVLLLPVVAVAYLLLHPALLYTLLLLFLAVYAIKRRRMAMF